MPSALPDPESRRDAQRFWLGYVVVCLLALTCEAPRWLTASARTESLSGWLSGTSPDWLPFLPWLLLAPVAWRIFRPVRTGNQAGPPRWFQAGAADDPRPKLTVLTAAGLFLFALLASRWAGGELHGLPPAYHDEYSYLIQAQTFLQGSLFTASFGPAAELLDQMHVLNEGIFASRYFPGTGLWIMPFLAWGDPWLGHQFAQALTCMMLFWIGRELSSHAVGLLAAILFALSPGFLIFSNLLLAHHPTLVGLMFFLWAFLKWLRTGVPAVAWLAGCGLTGAMLCRPMTAAGFSLPFGLLIGLWWLTGRPRLAFQKLPEVIGFRKRSAAALGMGLPILIGIAGQMFVNQRITGSVWTSPYQLYTDLYTPRHGYGFNNVVRGEERAGPKTLENYDKWAENLTPRLAAKNVAVRVTNSLRWSLGIVPLLLGCLPALLALIRERLIRARSRGDRASPSTPLDAARSPFRNLPGWSLVAAAILSLHLVHVPYWFEGIMGWHYVLETGPLWLLLFAQGTTELVRGWKAVGRIGMVWWWRGLIGLSLAVNLMTIPPLWPGRLDRSLIEVGFPRQRYARFREQVDTLRSGARVIVFVIPDESDRHMDYVTNDAGLDGDVLVARLHDPAKLNELRALFPDRKALLFDAASRQFLRIE